MNGVTARRREETEGGNEKVMKEAEGQKERLMKEGKWRRKENTGWN